MSKTFRAWNVDQAWLLPPSVHDFVPAGHPAHLVRELVRSERDLAAILAEYDKARGQPPYHPAMMVALLLYALTQGLYASRRIAKACEERLDFMAVTGLQRPDFRTISDFRQRHLAALAGLFVQVLQLCRKAGLVRLGHLALDGTKLAANASRHKAMSYGRMAQAEAGLAAAVEGWLAKAAAADATDDAAHGATGAAMSCPTGSPTAHLPWFRSRPPKRAIQCSAQALEARLPLLHMRPARPEQIAQHPHPQHPYQGGQRLRGGVGPVRAHAGQVSKLQISRSVSRRSD